MDQLRADSDTAPGVGQPVSQLRTGDALDHKKAGLFKIRFFVRGETWTRGKRQFKTALPQQAYRILVVITRPAVRISESLNAPAGPAFQRGFVLEDLFPLLLPG